MSDIAALLRVPYDSISSSPHHYFAQDARIFFQLVDQLVRPDSVVVDFGAGRGRQAEIYPEARLKGRVARVIGLDIDPAVMTNPYLDEAHVIDPNGKLPVADASADILFAYAVLEHVEFPEAMAAEIRRVLKPGGWFCAWTPNKWSYVGICVRAIPNRFHARLLDIVQPRNDGHKRTDADVFPTLYRMNTIGVLRRLFPEFHDASFTGNGEPGYDMGLEIVRKFWRMVMRLGPASMRKALFVFMQKPE